ncbi:hypothetical protein A3SI_04182 [Nitritalea halalkaliphila LW7]|uniref:Lipoprotein n=1 Tax=Nitritalea halalkaliphila LW7 TaxID=1189621 RepID=I5C913_9BACT|nr:hypothetical protein [Nitritalea halalkaliphila]EIM78315.1 hypothetical protein A3SI_04182 [Nitritalea halalkaliphila LW7]
MRKSSSIHAMLPPFLGNAWIALGFSLFFLSCDLETPRALETNLLIEAEELVRIERTLVESTFLGVLPWETYSETSWPPLPGCPSIQMLGDTLALTFISPREEGPEGCERLLNRGGNLRIVRGEREGRPLTRIEYDNYLVRAVQVNGVREFILQENGIFEENSPAPIRLTYPSGSSARISIQAQHELAEDETGAPLLRSTVTRSGQNQTGRSLLMSSTRPTERLRSCWEQDRISMRVGETSARIGRAAGMEVRHTVTFGQELACTSFADVTLEDGRLVRINFTED